MSDVEASEITRLLRGWNDGDENSKEKLLPIVYDELKRQARILMSRERTDHTPTALVHEAFVKLTRQSATDWKDRRHFYAISSRMMRQILVDHARGRSTSKRGNAPIFFSLDDVQVPVEQRASLVIALDEVLEKLEKLDKRQASIVEMKFFGGMTYEAIADVLDISARTVRREWQATRLWLYRELKAR